MVASIDWLRAAGVLSPLDQQFARALGRIGREERPEVLLAAALASRRVGDGHVCLDLARCVEEPLSPAGGEQRLPSRPWPTLSEWLTVLRSSPLVGGPDGVTPLVLDEAGRLYLRRYWEHEASLAAALRVRAAHSETTHDEAWLNAALDRLFPEDSVTGSEIDWQRMAAVLALLRRLCVISGGPGTGKTFTVVKILALLIEEALQRGDRPPRMTLVAPTGKAAARLSESIRRAKAQVHTAEAVRRAIPEEAATIHRCLGPIGDSDTRFRHHRDNPLITDVVLVDEASMVDLALMSRLVAATPLAARLILLGDQDQLASVEAGAVLGDICDTGARRCYSHALVAQTAALLGGRLRREPAAPADTGIYDCIVQLTRSYRYQQHSGIGQLARAINAGDSGTVLGLLESAEFREVSRVEPVAGRGLGAALRAAAIGGYRRYLTGGTPAEQLSGLEHFRVLCAHRHGPQGVAAVNQEIEAALDDAALIDRDSAFYLGRPVMVTRNDYQLGLFNGDVGLVLADAHGERRLVYFQTEHGQLRGLGPSRLPPHETVFAMSVHKSQGSEFDEVVVVLPAEASPVISRELLYTAVTRARQRVTLYATRGVIAQAIARRCQRSSGLRDALWGRAK